MPEEVKVYQAIDWDSPAHVAYMRALEGRSTWSTMRGQECPAFYSLGEIVGFFHPFLEKPLLFLSAGNNQAIDECFSSIEEEIQEVFKRDNLKSLKNIAPRYEKNIPSTGKVLEFLKFLKKIRTFEQVHILESSFRPGISAGDLDACAYDDVGNYVGSFTNLQAYIDFRSLPEKGG